MPRPQRARTQNLRGRRRARPRTSQGGKSKARRSSRHPWLAHARSEQRLDGTPSDGEAAVPQDIVEQPIRRLEAPPCQQQENSRRVLRCEHTERRTRLIGGGHSKGRIGTIGGRHEVVGSGDRNRRDGSLQSGLRANDRRYSAAARSSGAKQGGPEKRE